MQALAGKRLVIVVGKGGVGKTTTAAAVALETARRGRRTLLVTIDPAKRLADSLGVPVGASETEVAPHLWAMMLDPAAVIREHLEERVPQAKVTEHPLVRHVTSAMPGLNELMAIGKLNDLRREERFDVIVVDTAPTGHALSFLSAPRTIRELLSERSLIGWAVKAYAIYQKLQGAARTVGNVLSRGPRKPAPPDIDFERLFREMEAEAQRIQAFLTDPEHSALLAVAIPEKLPVEETIELTAAVRELGMRLHAVVVNKVQPDSLGRHHARLDELVTTARSRRAFVRSAAKATGDAESFHEGLVAAAEFSRIRRMMNLEWVGRLRAALPGVPLVLLPLFREDVEGLRKLDGYRAALFEGEKGGGEADPATPSGGGPASP